MSETASASPSALRSAVVYNPTKVDAGRLRTAVLAAAAAAGAPEPTWYETTRDDAGQLLTGEALADGAELVIAAGGDGTVRAVAEGLRGSGSALGIVPVGTGNILARNLGLPLTSLDSAATIAYGSQQRVIDVGVATLTDADAITTEHAFLVMAGLGFDAAMIANTNSDLKSRFGWLAYVDAGVRTLPTLGKVAVRYKVDAGESHTAHMSGLLVANCGTLPGNIELFPSAHLDDGRLDVAVLQPKSFFGWLAIWRKVTWENRVLRKSSLGRRYIQLTTGGRETVISYLAGQAIEVSVEDAEPFEIDGDDFGSVTAARLEIDAGSLIVKTLS